MYSAVAGYFRLLLFFSSAVSRIAWSAERICTSESVRSLDLTFESRGSPIAVEVLRRAQARVDRCGVCAVADGEWCVVLIAVASRASRLLQRAGRSYRWPPVLRPPTAPAPPIARTLMPPRVQAAKALFAGTPFPFGFFRSLAVSLSLTISELERRQLKTTTSMFRRRQLCRIARRGRRPPANRDLKLRGWRRHRTAISPRRDLQTS